MSEELEALKQELQFKDRQINVLLERIRTQENELCRFQANERDHPARASMVATLMRTIEARDDEIRQLRNGIARIKLSL